MTITLRLLLALCLTVLLVQKTQALEFSVNSIIDLPDSNPGDGVCFPEGTIPGFCTLRAAIMEANANPGSHTITLPNIDTRYALDETGINEDSAVTGDLDIHGDIMIVSTGPAAVTISGDLMDRVFDIHPTGKLRIENVGVELGSANFSDTIRGGAFFVRASLEQAGMLEISQSRVSVNRAQQGGAIFNNGVVLIDRSDFSFNALTDDGILEFAGGTAIRNRGVVIIDSTTFRENGVFLTDSGYLPDEHVIHSEQGFTPEFGLRVTNSTFYDNTNGLLSHHVPTELRNVTLVENNLVGLEFIRDPGALGQLQLRVAGSVFYGHGQDCNDILGDDGEIDVSKNQNASSDASCGFSGLMSHENIAFPFIGSAADFGGLSNTFMPQFDSILVDAIATGCDQNPNDQRGVERPQDGNGNGEARCDIGAVEYHPAIDPGIFSDGFE